MNIEFLDSKLPSRLWAKIAQSPDGCWVWHGQRSPKGYGITHDGGKIRRAHRVVYLALVGPITEQTLDHLCRNRACVNPAHLEPVSNRVNILRGDGVGVRNTRKTECPRGHLLSGANLYLHFSRKGVARRHCRTCRAERDKKRSQMSRHGARA